MEQDPVGGYRLLAAVSKLLPDPHLAVFAASLRSRNPNDPRHARSITNDQEVLWEALAAALQSGTLRAEGFTPGAVLPSSIHPAFFNNATPNFDQDSVTFNGATYAGVRIFRGSNTAPLLHSLVPPIAGLAVDGRRPFDLAAARAELTGIKVGWERGGKQTPAPTEEDIRRMVAQRFLDGWVREDIRTLHRIWSEADRRRGPRKSAADWRNSPS